VSTTGSQLDTSELEQRVKRMYEEVALEADNEFHFETGRALAEWLGYPAAALDQIPAEAIESFAGVGYFLDLAGTTLCVTSSAARSCRRTRRGDVRKEPS
jgi:arsenite methyltransferase